MNHKTGFLMVMAVWGALGLLLAAVHYLGIEATVCVVCLIMLTVFSYLLGSLGIRK